MKSSIDFWIAVWWSDYLIDMTWDMHPGCCNLHGTNMEPTAQEDAEQGDFVDRMTREDRRKTMAAVKNRDTDIEMLVRRSLWARGYRYRVRTSLIGRPDIVFPSERIVVFCDGCFWHGCPVCKEQPATNTEFWSAKIAANKARDEQVTRELQEAGWTVLRYWGCEIRKDLERVVEDIEFHLARAREESFKPTRSGKAKRTGPA